MAAQNGTTPPTVEQLELQLAGMSEPQKAQLAGILTHAFSPRALMVAASSLNGPITRETLSLAQRLTSHGGERGYYDLFGYPTDLRFRDYWERYSRGDVATRIIDLPVNATWRGSIEIPAFAKWADLERRLGVTSKLAATDRLAQIGEFAVLWIGVDDGQRDFAQPIEKGSLKVPEKLMFLRQYGQNAVTIKTVVTDELDPRIGLPNTYEIELTPITAEASTQQSARKVVHWTRLLHVPSKRVLNDVLGLPKLQNVFNRLLDLEKTAGGSAEMFWQNAAGKLVVKRDTPYEGNDDEAQAAWDQQIKNFIHGLKRVIELTGSGDVKKLEADNPQPAEIAGVLMQLISAGSGIPSRILFGSERGELASTQDRNNFADDMSARRMEYAEPVLVRQLLERLEYFGIVQNSMVLQVEWPAIDPLAADEQAAVQEKRALAMKNIAPGGDPGNVFTNEEIRETLGFDPDGGPDFSIDERQPEKPEELQDLQARRSGWRRLLGL